MAPFHLGFHPCIGRKYRKSSSFCIAHSCPAKYNYEMIFSVIVTGFSVSLKYVGQFKTHKARLMLNGV